jgi:predicted metal-binding membrane protein
MRGMDAGVATRLGSFRFFAASWMPMMAVMTLPGAVPAVLRRTRASGSVLAALIFTATYIAIWAIVGIAVYASYRPHARQRARASQPQAISATRCSRWACARRAACSGPGPLPHVPSSTR